MSTPETEGRTAPDLEVVVTTIDKADGKLSALVKLLWLVTDLSGGQSEHLASVIYSIGDARSDLERAQDMLGRLRP